MKERLSALMDGELSEHEQAQLLADLTRDPELAQTWEHYHVIRAALRKELGPLMLGGLSERVAGQIDSVSVGDAVAPARQPWRPAVRWTSGFALAATVTAIAILSAQWWEPDDSGPGRARLAVAPVAPTNVMSAGMTRWDAGEPEVTHLLNTYLVEHNEMMPAADIKGVMAYGRLVGYDEKR